MRLRRWLLFPLLLLTLVGSLLAFRPAEYYFEIAKNIDIFTTIIREVNTHYVDEIEPNSFVREGIDAMLSALDPYTNFISASDIEDFRFMSTGQYGGIGASIVKRDSQIFIADPYVGWPAYTSGLRAGDQLLRIAEEDLIEEDYSIEDVRNLLRGQPNTQVKVKARRPYVEDTFTVTITRQNIQVPSIRYAGVVAPGVGYVQLRSFTENAGRDVLNASILS
jgi:Periplasmic protease